MAKREILAGATDQTVDVFIEDSSSTVGAGLTGLVFNTASLTCYYRKGATGTPTALTLATQTVGGAHSDGGFVAVDGTNCPGQYRLDLSDTIVATAGMVTLYLRGATNMVPCLLEIEVVSVNKFDSVRMGLTALPNAAADGAGGLPISDAGGLDLDAKIGALTFTVANKLDSNALAINGSTTAASLLSLAALCIGSGTVDTGATTTSIPIKTLNSTLHDVDQLVGRVILFAYNAENGLKLQATTIEAVTLSPDTLTVTALTRAPAEDTAFVIQ